MTDITTPAAESAPVIRCLGCQVDAPSEPPPASWSRAVERGRTVWTCPTCSRENLRSIEGKLDSTWW